MQIVRGDDKTFSIERYDAGVYSFEIKGADTEKLSYGTYYLDIVIYENNKKRTVHLDELEVTKHYNFNEEEMLNE